LGWVAMAIVGGLLFLYVGRFITIGRLQAELALLHEQERVALALKEQLEARLARSANPETIERLARDLLGLVRPGEEKVIFLEED